MSLLIKYLGLCWFRNNPTELIPEKSFMIKVIVFYFLSGWVVEGLIADPADGFLEVLLRIIMAFSSISVFLLVNKKWDYFNQLVTAIFVCEDFILPLAASADGGLYHYMVVNNIRYYEAVTGALATIFLIWYLLIVAYILRKLFKFEITQSIILAVGYFVLTYGIPMMFMDM